MEKIHIATPAGRREELDGAEVLEEWEAGEIPGNSLYWKKGMPTWLPLAGYIDTLAAAVAPPPAAIPTVVSVVAPADPDAPFNPYATPTLEVPAPAGSLPPGHYAFVKKPRLLANVLIVFLSIYLLFTVLSLLCQGEQFLLLGRSATPEEQETNALRIGMIGVLCRIAYYATVVVFSMWTYRVAVNSRGFGARGMQDTPGWSVGSYFIPIFNLFRPYEYMKEIWQVSADPMNWKEEKGSGLLATWWTFWLVSMFLPRVAGVLFRAASTPMGYQTATLVSILSVLSGIAVTIAAIILVHTLTQRQEALVARGGV